MQLLPRLDAGKGQTLVLVLGGVTPPTLRDIPVIAVPTLPAADRVEQDARLLVLGQRAGVARLVVLRPTDSALLYPRDRLAPFVVGLAPRLVGIDVARLPQVLAIEATLDRLLDAAEARDANAINTAAEALRAQIGEDREAVALRARFALTLVERVGLVLDRPDDDDGASRASSRYGKLDDSARARSPYESFLRVRLAKKPRDAWRMRRNEILPAIDPSRRAALAAYFDPPRPCAEPRPSSPIETPSDLELAAISLRALPGNDDALVGRCLDLVESSHTEWAFGSLLLEARRHTTAPPHITRIARALTTHIAVLSDLVRIAPLRFPFFSALGLALHPGSTLDASVHASLGALATDATQRKLAAAKTPKDLLMSTIWAAVATVVHHTLRGAPLLAAATTARARLDGDMRDATGWSVAALELLDALYGYVAQQRLTPDATAQKVVRALQGADDGQKAARQIAIATTMYAAAALDDRLDPQTPSGAPRAALAEALLLLGDDSDKPSLAEVNAVADFADALLAGVAKLFRTAPSPELACRGPKPVRPEALALRQRVDPMRRALLASTPTARGAWSSRSRLLVQLLSDVLDIAAGGPTRFFNDEAEARQIIEVGVRATLLAPYASGIGAAYALLRHALATPATQRKPFDANSGIAIVRGLDQAFDGKDTLQLGLDRLPASFEGSFDALCEHMATKLTTANRSDEAQAWLLLAAFDAVLEEKPLSDGILRLAMAPPSRLMPILVLVDERLGYLGGRSADPERAQRWLRPIADEACVARDAELTFTGRRVIVDVARGRWSRAREMVTKILGALEKPDAEVPLLQTNYLLHTETRTLNLELRISMAAPFFYGGTFQLGLGVRTRGEPSLEINAKIASQARADRDAHVLRFATVSAAYAMLLALWQGDVATADRLSATHLDLLLGERTAVGKRALDATGFHFEDVRQLLAVVAVLAADAGMPGLGAELWRRVAQYADDLTEAKIHAMFARPPLGLTHDALRAVRDKARLGMLVATMTPPRGCPPPAKQPPIEVVQPRCDYYPLAASLWLADIPFAAQAPPVPAGCTVDATIPLLLALQGKSLDVARLESTVAALIDRRPGEAARVLRSTRARSPRLKELATRLATEGFLDERTQQHHLESNGAP